MSEPRVILYDDPDIARPSTMTIKEPDKVAVTRIVYLYTDPRTGQESWAATEAEARRLASTHRTCPTCGEVFTHWCGACRAVKDAASYEMAEQATWDAGWVSDGVHYWEDQEALLGYCIEAECPPSELELWVCEAARPRLDYSDFLECYVDNVPEGEDPHEFAGPEVAIAHHMLQIIVSKFWPETWFPTGKRLTDAEIADLDLDYFEEAERSWRRHETPGPQPPAVRRKSSSLARRRHPRRTKARKAVGRAIAAGRLVVGPCAVCGLGPKKVTGRQRIQAHHYKGYAKQHWLDVAWLCVPHHVAADKEVAV